MLAYLLDEDTDGTSSAPCVGGRLPPAGSGSMFCGWGRDGAPPSGTLDPDLLAWCEANDRILVSNDRSTMPGHFHDHTAAGRHSPGVLLIRFGVNIGRAVSELEFIAAAGEPDDLRDLIQYIPLR